MIPLKVELKNFLSYGDQIQKIDFSDYPLICLSGKNGHGKSALLDAITWALWGQARKTSGRIKADDGLIRLGKTHMIVSLEFEFNKNLYRVKREYFKTYGRPHMNLDFDVWDKDKNEFITLTDKTTKLTGKKIENLLGLDFDTFINSAFLKQGQANEFSKKPPRERKQILANILGFCRYDELQKLSSDKAKKYAEEKKLLSKFVEQFEKELEQEVLIKNDLNKAKEELQQADKEIKEIQKSLAEKEKTKALFADKQKQHDYFVQEKEKLNDRLNMRTKEFNEKVLQWKKVHRLSLTMPDITKLKKELNSLQEKEKEILIQQQKSLNLQEQILKKESGYQKMVAAFKNNIEKEINKLRFDLEKEELRERQFSTNIRDKENYRKELEEKLNKAEKEYLFVKKKLTGEDQFRCEFEEIKKQFAKRREFYQVLVQKGNWIRSVYQELLEKNKTLHENQSPSCPLCQQLLTVKRKKFLSSKFCAQEKRYKNRLARIGKVIASLKSILLEQHEQVIKSEKEVKKYSENQSKHQELKKQIEQIKKDLKSESKLISKFRDQKKEEEEKAKVLRKRLQTKEKELEVGLQKNEKIKFLDREVAKLKTERDKINYDKKVHEKIRQDFKKVQVQLEDLSSLKNSIDLQKENKRAIRSMSIQAKEIKAALRQIENKIKELNFDKTQEKELDSKITALQKEWMEKSKIKEEILQKAGRGQNALARLEQIKNKNKENLEKASFLDQEINEHKFLSEIFGKDGIQALLIEEAIPEIEQEANKILSKLTDNQAQIFFESLRDLKKGGVKETLDIQISDAAGVRPYEMFSGGEAFRIDFALRIAISKLLARRAGTALQTLIIDEGFGSQDEEGLSRLMDSIYAIQDEFSKIIIVSHLSSLKHSFPVHFLVNKTSVGSQILVQERG